MSNCCGRALGAEALADFGESWREYAAHTPGFIPFS